jgi:hypothetical protein
MTKFERPVESTTLTSTRSPALTACSPHAAREAAARMIRAYGIEALLGGLPPRVGYAIPSIVHAAAGG